MARTSFFSTLSTRHLSMLMGLLFAADALANGGCTRGNEQEPPLCPSSLPSVSSITIVNNAATAVSTVKCDDFRLDEKQVREFLRAARQTEAERAHAVVPWSPCYANGEVTFSNGETGVWDINQGGLGEVVTEGEQHYLLYCQACPLPK